MARSLPVRAGVRLALDVGSVRIGVARSDPGGFLASPLTTVRRGRGAGSGQGPGSWRGDLTRLARLVRDQAATEVIVGLPASLSGAEGKAAVAARSFAVALADRIAPVPVRLVDERFTTVTAHDALRTAGRDSRARRGVVDQAAAAVLLQAALDAERASGGPPGELVSPARREPRSAGAVE